MDSKSSKEVRLQGAEKRGMKVVAPTSRAATYRPWSGAPVSLLGSPWIVEGLRTGLSPPSSYDFQALPGCRVASSPRSYHMSVAGVGHRGRAVIQANGACIIWNSRGSRRNFSLASKQIR